MDIMDMIEMIVTTIHDWVTCKGNLKKWAKKTAISLLLGAACLGCIAVLVIGIIDEIWPLAFLGLAGLIGFGVAEQKFSEWWHREGKNKN